MATSVRVQGLGKLYQIEPTHRDYPTLREQIAGALRAPLDRLLKQHQGGVNTRFWALRNVSFAIERGEVLGVIGPNGAGKSTLLRILSRITEPTEGEAWIKGKTASLLEVGMGFHPELTGRENVFLNGAILGISRREIHARFGEIVAYSGLEAFIDTPVKRYSSGMYIRLAFAVAAQLDSDVLIVDEVLAVGDMVFQSRSLGTMKQASQLGRTVLFTSHNMNDIRRICHRCMLLIDGQVAFLGDVDGAIDAYTAHSMGGEARVPS